MDAVWYCTREDVKSALDSAETARNNVQIDRAIESATEAIFGLTHRVFYPWTGVRYFDWPNDQHASTGRLWLDQNELVSVSSLTTSGTSISATDYFLEPANSGPPFTHVDLDLGSSAAFDGGDTHQRSIAITGVYCGCAADSEPAGLLAEALDSSETGVDATNSAAVGVGQIIKVDSERMIVTAKSMLTTGQTLQTPLTISNADVTVAVTNGSAYNIGEVILLDAERMLIVDIASNNLIVKRAWDGSVLASHAGSTIFAPRSLTVTRGALGTTAAAHSDTTAITKHKVPVLIKQLAIAEALTALQQEGSAYARVVGSGEAQREASGKGLADLRNLVYTRYARKVRARAV